MAESMRELAIYLKVSAIPDVTQIITGHQHQKGHFPYSNNYWSSTSEGAFPLGLCTFNSCYVANEGMHVSGLLLDTLCPF